MSVWMAVVMVVSIVGVPAVREFGATFREYQREKTRREEMSAGRGASVRR